MAAVHDVSEPAERGLEVRRVRMPSSGVESWTLVGCDRRPVPLVDEFLAWLTHIERSPNTVEAYARDLKLFWAFLVSRDLPWDRVTVAELGEFAAWARRPAENVVVLSELAARRSAPTVNRMLSAVLAFYEFQGRRGSSLARELVVQTRTGRGGYKPFLNGIAGAAPRGRAVTLPEQQRLPRTLSLEQVAAVIDAQRRLRDRFLFALLASTGMRIGQALSLRHEDVVSWERRIEIVPRPGSRARALSKGGARGSVPVPGELIRLWSDYMHVEYGELDSDFVFVNLCEGERGRPLSYGAVNELIRRTRRRVGFHFTAHQFRHTYATLAYRDGVALEVIGTVLTHRSPHSTRIYTHPTAEDLREALSERGVLDRVADLVA
ncbi:MAG: site-specific integrase [Actinobacteria bacterium]|nr:site-specific integrase [Actinomycetota bacterium]